MDKNWDLSPRKVGQIQVLFSESALKYKEIARLQLIISMRVKIMSKLDYCQNLSSKIFAKYDRKRKTSLRLCRKITGVALSNRRACYREISFQLSEKGTSLSRRTGNLRLQEGELKDIAKESNCRLQKL